MHYGPNNSLTWVFVIVFFFFFLSSAKNFVLLKFPIWWRSDIVLKINTQPEPGANHSPNISVGWVSDLSSALPNKSWSMETHTHIRSHLAEYSKQHEARTGNFLASVHVTVWIWGLCNVSLLSALNSKMLSIKFRSVSHAFQFVLEVQTNLFYKILRNLSDQGNISLSWMISDFGPCRNTFMLASDKMADVHFLQTSTTQSYDLQFQQQFIEEFIQSFSILYKLWFLYDALKKMQI